MLEYLVSCDRALFLFLNTAFSHPWCDHFFMVITRRNSWIVPGIIAAIVFVVKERKKALIVLGLCIITAAISDPFCVRVLKPFFHRMRPCHPSYFIDGTHMFLAGGHFLLGYKKSFSFPSAHAVNMFAQAMLLTLFYPKHAVWFFLIAVPIAFSRIYLGVHYPSDFFVGALVGLGISSLVFYGYYYIHLWITLRDARKHAH